MPLILSLGVRVSQKSFFITLINKRMKYNIASTKNLRVMHLKGKKFAREKNN